MSDYLILALALGLAVFGAIVGLIGYYAYWKPHRQRQIERQHFRSKLNSPRG